MPQRGRRRGSGARAQSRPKKRAKAAGAPRTPEIPADSDPPLPPHAVIFSEVVAFLRRTLERECRKERWPIVDEFIQEQVLERIVAATGHATFGDQVRALAKTRDKFIYKRPPDRRGRRSKVGPFVLWDYDELRGALSRFRRDLAERPSGEKVRVLKARYPGVPESRLREAMAVIPSEGARIILADHYSVQPDRIKKAIQGARRSWKKRQESAGSPEK